MKKRTNVIIFMILLLSICFVFGAYFFNINYHRKIKLHPKMYAYQTYWGTVNSVLVIEDLKYKDDLIKYYSEIILDSTANPVIKVPLKTLPQSEVVYVIDYTKDSLLVNVVSYYDRGAKLGGSYLRGWVYSKTLHKEPPQKQNN